MESQNALPPATKKRRGRPRKNPCPDSNLVPPATQPNTRRNSQTNRVTRDKSEAVLAAPSVRINSPGRAPKRLRTENNLRNASSPSSNTRSSKDNDMPQQPTRPAPDLPDVVVGSFRHLVEYLEKHREENQENLEKLKMTQSDLPKLKDLRNPPKWTDGAEQQVMVGWNVSAEKLAIAKLADRQAEPADTEEVDTWLSLWRVSTHLYRSSPFAFVSPSIGLYHDGNELRCPGSADVAWSEDFCKRLHLLLTHPFWRGQSAILSEFIRYAVVLRTDDRRRMPMSPLKNNCWVLQALAKEAWAGLNVDLHTAHCDLRKASSYEVLSAESDLLFELGSRIQAKYAGKSYPTREDDGRWEVKSEDLLNIITTLDKYKAGTGIPAFLMCELINFTYMRARGRISIPARHQLGELQKKAWLSHLRMLHHNQARFPTGPSRNEANRGIWADSRHNGKFGDAHGDSTALNGDGFFLGRYGDHLDIFSTGIASNEMPWSESSEEMGSCELAFKQALESGIPPVDDEESFRGFSDRDDDDDAGSTRDLSDEDSVNDDHARPLNPGDEEAPVPEKSQENHRSEEQHEQTDLKSTATGTNFRERSDSLAQQREPSNVDDEPEPPMWRSESPSPESITSYPRSESEWSNEAVDGDSSAQADNPVRDKNWLSDLPQSWPDWSPRPFRDGNPRSPSLLKAMFSRKGL